LEQLTWSLDVAPSAGVNLKVESPSGTTIFSIDVSTQGVGFIPFSGSCLAGAYGKDVIVTLAAPGSGVTGKLSVIRRMDGQGAIPNRPSGA
jgi:hypothetical protein